MDTALGIGKTILLIGHTYFWRKRSVKIEGKNSDSKMEQFENDVNKSLKM